MNIDFNPKTNTWARATYEVLGYGAATIAAVAGAITLLILYPVVAVCVITVCLLAWLAYMIITIRQAELEHDKRWHDIWHDGNSKYRTTNCKYCVAAKDEETPAPEPESEPEPAGPSVPRSIPGHTHLHLSGDWDRCKTPGLNGTPGINVRCSCGSYHH